MEFEQKNNGLLGRKELAGLLTSEANPGIENVKKMIAEEMKAELDLVVVRKLESKFGSNDFVFDALVYDSLNVKNMVEPKQKKKKGAAGVAK
jgi:ribosomal protein S24E